MSDPLPSFRNWLFAHAAELDALLLDVDGVLMTSGCPLPGSLELVTAVREHHIPFLLLTNDGCNSPGQKLAGLARGGLEFQPSELVSCGHALEECVAEQGWQGETFFVMGELGDPCYAQAAQLRTTRDLSMLDSGTCRGILVGEKDYDWERTITAVFNFLVRHPTAPVVVPNPDVFFPLADGKLHPASGATVGFVGFLCQAYGLRIEPIFLGKPYAPIFRHAQRVVEQRVGHAVLPSRLFMLGDSLTGDIRGGRNYGTRTGLMLTGITSAAMLAASEVQPELVFSSL
jgi:HAD superfamily hydrolase (TIGR01450 family)